MYKEEVRFLASLIANPSLISLLKKDVSQYDFREQTLYVIYKGVIDFLANGKEPSFQELKFKFKGDEDQLNYLDKIENESTITSDLETAYKEMSDRSQHVRLQQHVKMLLNEVEQPDIDVDKCITNFETTLTNIRLNSGSEIHKVSSVVGGVGRSLSERVKHYRKTGAPLISIPTGIEALDQYTGGLATKNIWLLGAGSSDGKTQLGVQIIQNILSTGQKVFWFQCEDSKENLVERLLSTRNKIRIKDIRSGAITEGQYKTLNADLQKMRQEDNLFIEEELTDIDSITSKAKLAKLKYPDLSVIVVDYVGLLMDNSRSFGTREQEISFISKKLIQLAKSCNVAVLCLTQLNTAPDERSWGIPIRLNDVRDSKATGHDAAVAIFLHHPLKYGLKGRRKAQEGDEHKKAWAERNKTKYSFLILAKNRYGETGKVIELTNRAEVMRFDEGKPEDCPFGIEDFM
jgi:replicative DNA helicase